MPPALFIMIKAIVLLLGILLFRVMLPRRQRRTNATISPYGSVFDVAVPDELARSGLWSVKEPTRQRVRRSQASGQATCYAGRE